jgi:SAM-dependent methyltransferase
MAMTNNRNHMTGSRAKFGELDWNRVWKALQDRHVASEKFHDPTHNWDKKANAKRYSEGSKGEFDARIRMTIDGLPLTKETRVLDIGAGPGTLAIPLAGLVKEVTAVEPGKGMVSVLKENMRNGGIKNITCVQKLWEDCDVARDLEAPYDIVLSSLSLTMEDLAAALAKMDAAASGYVCIFWFADPPFWEKMYVDLWPALHGEPFYPGPKADCVFAVLYQMGIRPNVEMLPLKKEYRFATVKEMAAFFRDRFGITTQKQRKALNAYLAPLIRREGGEVVISGNSTLAKVWWKKALPIPD